jgi:hypothetical protein
MKNSIKELVDPTLGDAYDSEQIKVVNSVPFRPE